MISRLDAQRFAIDFSKARRPQTGAMAKLLSTFSTANAEVDPWAISQALCAVLPYCKSADGTGQVLMWNDFRLFLDANDYEALLKKSPDIQHEVGPGLEQTVLKLKAKWRGIPVLRLHVDENREVKVGHGVVRVDWQPDQQLLPSKPGEVTVRLDKGPTVGGLPGANTERAGPAMIKVGASQLTLLAGVRHVVGRDDPNPSADHLALPGATSKINRRQASITVSPNTPAGVTVGREADANPVSVNQTPLERGASVTVPLPAEVMLSGALRLEIVAC